jgi:hypothetical protein
MAKAAMRILVFFPLATSDQRLVTAIGHLLKLIIEVDQVAHRLFSLTPLFTFR